jgi:hypothetical protein
MCIALTARKAGRRSAPTISFRYPLTRVRANRKEIMKSLKLIASAIALAVLSMGSAWSAKPEEECPPTTEKSTRARADVKGEAKQAAKSPEGKGEYDCPAPSKTSTKARKDVKAEAKEAVKKGEVGKGEADIKK